MLTVECVAAAVPAAFWAPLEDAVPAAAAGLDAGASFLSFLLLVTELLFLFPKVLRLLELVCTALFHLVPDAESIWVRDVAALGTEPYPLVWVTAAKPDSALDLCRKIWEVERHSVVHDRDRTILPGRLGSHDCVNEAARPTDGLGPKSGGNVRRAEWTNSGLAACQNRVQILPPTLPFIL